MSKFRLEYKEETGYDIGVYCESADNEKSIWYFEEHYVEWLEKKIEALSQVVIMKKEVSVCDYEHHEENINLNGYCPSCDRIG